MVKSFLCRKYICSILWFTLVGLIGKCGAALTTEGSVQLQSSLSGLPHCIIQHVLLKPTINKLTAPDSLGEPELPEVNTLEMTRCPHNTTVQHPFGSIWHPEVEIQRWNALERFVFNTTAVMKANKASFFLSSFLSPLITQQSSFQSNLLSHFTLFVSLSAHLCKAPPRNTFLSIYRRSPGVLPVSLSAFPLCWPDWVAFR